MKLDKNHFYKMRGWDVLIKNADTSKRPSANQVQNSHNTNKQSENISPNNSISKYADGQSNSFSAE